MCQVNRSDVEPVTGIAGQLSGQNIVGRAPRSRSITRATASNNEGGVVTQLRGDAQQAVAIPLVVRNKVVAVLYADSAWPHPDAIQLEALEVLERVATMAVELVSPRAAQAPKQSAPAQPKPAAETAPESKSAEPTEAAAGEMPAVGTSENREPQPSET